MSEEFLFRMFAIPFLRKLVRSTGVAVIAAGLVWGFGHAGYPNQPFYIRGVEVGIVGIIMGCIMLRWGVLVGLVWHYSIDAIYSALLLFRSPSWYFRLSGAACAGLMLLPVLIALVAYWRRGGFEPEAGVRNQDEPVAPAAPRAEARPEAPPFLARSHAALSPGLRWAAGLLFALGLLASFFPAARLDSAPPYGLDAAQALGAGDAFLRSQQIDPASYRHLVFPDAEISAGKYFLDHGSIAAAAELFRDNRPIHRWGGPLLPAARPEGLMVNVHPATGAILGFSHTLPEEQAGADLPEAEARQRAETMAHSLGRDVAGMELKVHTSEKKPHRRDYAFTWEARAGDPRNLAEAHFRVQAGGWRRGPHQRGDLLEGPPRNTGRSPREADRLFPFSPW